MPLMPCLDGDRLHFAVLDEACELRERDGVLPARRGRSFEDLEQREDQEADDDQRARFRLKFTVDLPARRSPGDTSVPGRDPGIVATRDNSRIFRRKKKPDPGYGVSRLKMA